MVSDIKDADLLPDIHYGVSQIGNSLYSDAALDVYPLLAEIKVSENDLGYFPSLPHKNAGIKPRIDGHCFLSSSSRFIVYLSILKFSRRK